VLRMFSRLIGQQVEREHLTATDTKPATACWC
jgi:hypothetical protein